MKIKVLNFPNGRIEIVEETLNIRYCDKDKTMNEVIDSVIEEYRKYDSSISDILSSICINNLSIEDVVTVYSRVYRAIEHDTVIRKYDEGGYIDLSDNITYTDSGSILR